MNLEGVRAGSYIRIIVHDHRSVQRYFIAKVHGFTLDPTIKNDSRLQLTAVYPRNETFVNISLSYETLEKLNAELITWNRPKKLMKLIYG